MEHRVIQPATSLCDANARMRVLSRQLMEVQEFERSAILRDLYDAIGQVLPLITRHLQELGQQPQHPDAAYRANQVSDSFQILDHVRHSICSLAMDLQPKMRDELGLLSALKNSVGRWQVPGRPSMSRR